MKILERVPHPRVGARSFSLIYENRYRLDVRGHIPSSVVYHASSVRERIRSIKRKPFDDRKS